MGFCFNHRKQLSSLQHTNSDKILSKSEKTVISRKNVKRSTPKLSARDRIFLQSIGLKLKPQYL
jgi:hypothetical protein